MLCFLERLGFLSSAFVDQSFLFVFTDFADHLIVEILNDMKIVVDNLQMRTAHPKCLFKIAVHITGYGLHAGHPVQTDTVYELIYRCLLPSMRKVQDMACFQVNDDGCVLMTIVELELIYGEELSTAVRLFEDLSFAVYRIETAQAFPVDILDGILVQTSKVCHFFQ